MENLDLLIDLHLRNPRQGPGGDAQAARALELGEVDRHAPLAVADIGCGTGAGTLALAQLLPRAHIHAVDILAPFLARLKERCRTAGVAARVTPVRASMDALPFHPNRFDLLWSEGAIYNMGFENGVRRWRGLLKPGGLLVVSELTWTTGNRPAALQSHWAHEYAEVDKAGAKLAVLERNGYAPVAYFALPPSCWQEHYDAPLAAGFDDFLVRQGHSASALAVVAEHRQEIALYDRYKTFFGYGVYVARRLD